MFGNCEECTSEECTTEDIVSNFKTCTYCETKMCTDCNKKHLCDQCLEDFVNFCYENKLCINDAREINNF